MLNLFIALAAVSFGQSATVDFRSLKADTVTVDMLHNDAVDIIVTGPSRPRVRIANGPLAQCAIEEFEKMDAQSYRIRVVFDPVLDDGVNGCSVFIASTARTRRVNMSVFVDT